MKQKIPKIISITKIKKNKENQILENFRLSSYCLQNANIILRGKRSYTRKSNTTCDQPLSQVKAVAIGLHLASTL